MRPDGYVTWRQEFHSADAAERLTAALLKVLGREEQPAGALLEAA